MKAGELFDLPTSLERFAEFFTPEMSPWEWVGNIKKALASVDFSSLDSKSDIPKTKSRMTSAMVINRYILYKTFAVSFT